MDNLIILIKKLIQIIFLWLRKIYLNIVNFYISQNQVKKQYNPLIYEKELLINELYRQLQHCKKQKHQLETNIDRLTTDNKILKEKIETMQELFVEK